MNPTKPSPAPAAPNECLILGRIAKVDPAPGGVGTVWSVELEGTTDLPGAPNFARRASTSVIRVLVHPGLKETFEPEAVVEARVSYQGDERGGAFFLMGQDVRRVPKD
jgi:hypothetical protein